jgi:hypothetical protein
MEKQNVYLQDFVFFMTFGIPTLYGLTGSNPCRGESLCPGIN